MVEGTGAAAGPAPASSPPDAPPPLSPEQQLQLERMQAALRKQIEETFKRAFWDSIAADLANDPQSFDHLLVLLTEVRGRLMRLTPSRRDLHNHINEVLDVDWLRELFNNKAFEPQHFGRLIVFLMQYIKDMEAPVHAESTQKWIESVQAELTSDIKYADFVPKFFKAFYEKLEGVEKEIAAFMAQHGPPPTQPPSPPPPTAPLD